MAGNIGQCQGDITLHVFYSPQVLLCTVVPRKQCEIPCLLGTIFSSGHQDKINYVCDHSDEITLQLYGTEK